MSMYLYVIKVLQSGAQIQGRLAGFPPKIMNPLGKYLNRRLLPAGSSESIDLKNYESQKKSCPIKLFDHKF